MKRFKWWRKWRGGRWEQTRWIFDMGRVVFVTWEHVGIHEHAIEVGGWRRSGMGFVLAVEDYRPHLLGNVPDAP